jgi:predicted AlkP superfamily phosphohydrolase/phosphomutase
MGGSRGRVIVIGADGLDATLFQRWIQDGQLPHLARVAEAGGWGPLTTTNPAESPVAWASFATGLNPGQHGIYDFVQRDPATYRPTVGPLTVRLRLDGQGLEAINHRAGTTFWAAASEAGRRCLLLRVPGTCPPEPVKGQLLSGLGVPDLVGSWGLSTLFTTGESNLRQRRQPLIPAGRNSWCGQIEGPKGLTLSVEVRREGASAIQLACQGQSAMLRRGEWSDWFSSAFADLAGFAWRGLVRFYARALDPEIELYQSPLQIDPRAPCLPLSYPDDYVEALVDRYGLFATLGWPEDATGLEEGRLDTAGFLTQVDRAFETQAEMTLAALEEKDHDLLVSVLEATDRVQHMFWPDYDVILDYYRRFDALVGEVCARLAPNDILFILSDHGFKPVQKMVHVNNWLRDQGWLVPAAGAEGRGALPRHVDWSRTRAYAVGLSKIYVNLQGREAQGSVTWADYARICEEIARGLARLQDPETGAPILCRVYLRDDLYHGAHLADSGDLILGFYPGYRTSRRSARGSWCAGPTISPNKKRWSADHCSIDPAFVPGVLCSNRDLEWMGASILDLAPTILTLLEAPVPPAMDGKSLVG